VRAALILLVLTTSAIASPRDDLDQARLAYRGGQYMKALPLFNMLVYPQARLADQDEQVEVYVALGVCRYLTGDPGGARREFVSALNIDSNTKIDPLIVTDPSVLQAFNETKREIQRKAEAQAAEKRRAELRALRASYVGFEQHQFYLSFLPFGVGQFQNGDTGKGIAFAASEAVTLITSAAIWGYLVEKYGIRSTHVALADGPSVRRLQQLELASGFTFIGIAVVGAIDAARHYKAQVRGEIDESLLPPELRDLDKPKTKPAKPKKTSLIDRLSPMVTPDGVGVGLAWEN
jgi:hypothetical protein